MLLKNRRGEGAILCCVLLIVLSAVFSALAEFTIAALTVSTVKRQARETLDSYIWEEGIISFGELKRDVGSGALSAEGYARRLADEKGLQEQDGCLVCYSHSGAEQYALSELSLSSAADWSYTLSFTLSVPLRIAGVSPMRIPLSVTGKGNYINKYGG